MKKAKVLVITSIRSYHQVDLFDAVSALGEVDLRVLYLSALTPGRLWTELPEPKHDYRMLRVFLNRSLLYFNPSILGHIRAASPDLIVICQYAGISNQAAMLYSSIARIPWVFWSENPGVQFFEVRNKVPLKLRPAFRQLAFLPAARWARQVWGIGSRAMETMEAMGARRLDELTYYSDLARFAGPRPDTGDEAVRFLFAGRLSYRKGFDVAVEAFKRLATRRNDWHLTICGDGELRNLIDELDAERVTNLGFKELPEVPGVMRKHDVLIAPSRYDGWGMVVPEALAAGMPVVTTTEMQSGVTIGEGHAPVVSLLPPGDAQALEQQLEWWLDHRKDLPRHQADAQELAKPFDVEVGAARFCALAKGVLEQP